MKKLFSLLLAVMMAFSVVGCTNNGNNSNNNAAPVGPELDENNVKLADTKNMVINGSAEITNMDYVTTAQATNHEWNVNFVDGLVEADPHGAYVPALAEKWEPNADASVWTFYLKKGVKWVTNTGEEYAEVKAEDFITGLRHAAEFASGTASVLFGSIKGFSTYYSQKDWSDAAWANVGIEAKDDYTLVFTLETAVPYFYTVAEYTCLYPINKSFLESKGAGCKLGAPDTAHCTFGTPVPDSILYNGGYILEANDAKSKIVIKKNAKYWDADRVYIDSVTQIYDDGSDTYSVMKAFEQGVAPAAGFNSSWEDFATYKAKYANYITTTLPDQYSFPIVFNFNRQVWDHTNYATDDAARENTHKAILNENFRKALRASFDALSYQKVSLDESVAAASLRVINGLYTFVSTSDGTPYGALIEAAYKNQTGEEVDLKDGQYPWLNKDAALKYIEEAKKEGVTFPVHLDMLVPETSKRLVNNAQSLKKSVGDNTDGQIVIELVLASIDDVQNIAYYNEDPAGSDYDISTFTGWGPDYVDPKTFVQIYSTSEGYYMTSLGLTSKDNCDPADYNKDKDIKDACGLTGYEDLYLAADKITGDLDARYKAFAEADAYMIAHCITIPFQMQGVNIRVSHTVPFTAIYSTGVTGYKYKLMKLQENIVTAKEYAAAKEAWEAGK
jgi:oligopeptide transport system substrate-binding protein